MKTLKLSDLLKIRESITSVTETLEDQIAKLKNSLNHEDFKIEEDFTRELFLCLDTLSNTKIKKINEVELTEKIEILNENAEELKIIETKFVKELANSRQSLTRFEWLINTNLITIQSQIVQVSRDIEDLANDKIAELDQTFNNLELLVNDNIMLRQEPIGADIIKKELDSLRNMLLGAVIQTQFNNFKTQTRSVFDEMQKESTKVASTKRSNIKELLSESVRRQVIREFFGNKERVQAMIKNIDLINNSIQSISKKIEHEIQVARTELIKKYNKGNDIRNNKSIKYSFPDEDSYYRNRLSYANSAVIEEMQGIIGKSIDWRFPIAYIEPNTSSLFPALVAGDPFYWIDDYDLPYKKLQKKTNPSNYRKILRYTKKQALELIEPENIGFCVNWNNFFFSPIFEIKKEIKYMADLVMPGGVVMFDYIDIFTSRGAAAVENYDLIPSDCDLIEKICKENGLVLENRLDFEDCFSTIVFYRKKGNLPITNLSGKLGIIQDKT